jgi:parallel beta-helix repeat protein
MKTTLVHLSDQTDHTIFAISKRNVATLRAATRCMATIAALLCFWAGPALAATYYVSPSGTDANSCAAAQSTTASSQKLTISSGVACLAPGDTLYIHGGRYTGGGNTINSILGTVRGGTNFFAGAITIAGYPGELVTIIPPDGQHGILLTTTAQQYLIFQDFVIDMINQKTPVVSPDGIYLSGGTHHNRFQRLEIKNNASSGVHFSSNGGASGYNELLNCVIHDNGRTDITGNGGYGIYLSTSNNLLEGNDFYANNGYGIHLNPLAGEGNNNVITRNRIHENFVHGTIGVGGSTSYGIVVIRGDSNLISNNLIYGNQGGVLIYNDASNTLIANNTITANVGHAGGGEYGVQAQYYGSGNVVRNNIIYSNANGAYQDDGGGTGGPITYDHNLETNPSFVNAGANDFRLQPTSAAKDKGVTLADVSSDFDGVARPQGAYDIGAYEYGGSVAPSVPKNVHLLP